MEYQPTVPCRNFAKNGQPIQPALKQTGVEQVYTLRKVTLAHHGQGKLTLVPCVFEPVTRYVPARRSPYKARDGINDYKTKIVFHRFSVHAARRFVNENSFNFFVRFENRSLNTPMFIWAYFNLRGDSMTKAKNNILPFVLGILILALAMSALMGAFGNASTAAAASNDEVLRLHVIANSDDDFDQAVKLQVRDAILPIFESAESYEDARAFLLSHGAEIQAECERVLKENGVDYGVELTLGLTHFPDRDYGGTFYPEGDYDALCVRLGAANGQNWWCVLFPPLCLITRDGQPVDLDELEFESDIIEWLRSIGWWFDD